MKDEPLFQKNQKSIKTPKETYDNLQNTDRQTFADGFRIVTKIGKNGKKTYSFNN